MVNFAQLTYLIPKLNFQNLTAAPVELLILNFAKYQYLFNTQIQNSKFDRGNGRILNFEFAKYRYLLTTQIQKSNFGRDSGRILISEVCSVP